MATKRQVHKESDSLCAEMRREGQESARHVLVAYAGQRVDLFPSRYEHRAVTQIKDTWPAVQARYQAQFAALNGRRAETGIDYSGIGDLVATLHQIFIFGMEDAVLQHNRLIAQAMDDKLAPDEPNPQG